MPDSVRFLTERAEELFERDQNSHEANCLVAAAIELDCLRQEREFGAPKTIYGIPLNEVAEMIADVLKPNADRQKGPLSDG